MKDPDNTFENNNDRRSKYQHRIGQRRHLCATPKTKCILVSCGSSRDSLCTPCKSKTYNIAKVMDRIANEGNGPKEQTNENLKYGKGSI